MILNRIGVLSCGKVVGILYAALGLIAGAFMAMFSVIGAAANQGGGGGDILVPFMFMGGAAIIIAPIFYGIMGFIGGVVAAAIYNLVASTFGGLELEFVRPTDGTPQSS